MATVTSVPGTLDITPDPLQKQSKVQIRRNNKKGRIEIVTSTDSGNNYKTLLPEVTSKVQSGSIPVVQESGDVEWSVLAAKASTLTGVVPYVNGGTGYGSYAAGDILYANQQGVLAKLPIGSTDQLLTVSNALPAWQDIKLSDAVSLGLMKFKASVKVATTAGIAGLSNNTSLPGDIDGIPISVGDRILVKDQTTTSQNGVYQRNVDASKYLLNTIAINASGTGYSINDSLKIDNNVNGDTAPTFSVTSLKVNSFTLVAGEQGTGVQAGTVYTLTGTGSTSNPPAKYKVLTTALTEIAIESTYSLDTYIDDEELKSLFLCSYLNTNKRQLGNDKLEYRWAIYSGPSGTYQLKGMVYSPAAAVQTAANSGATTLDFNRLTGTDKNARKNIGIASSNSAIGATTISVTLSTDSVIPAVGDIVSLSTTQNINYLQATLTDSTSARNSISQFDAYVITAISGPVNVNVYTITLHTPLTSAVTIFRDSIYFSEKATTDVLLRGFIAGDKFTLGLSTTEYTIATVTQSRALSHNTGSEACKYGALSGSITFTPPLSASVPVNTTIRYIGKAIPGNGNYPIKSRSTALPSSASFPLTLDIVAAGMIGRPLISTDYPSPLDESFALDIYSPGPNVSTTIAGYTQNEKNNNSFKLVPKCGVDEGEITDPGVFTVKPSNGKLTFSDTALGVSFNTIGWAVNAVSIVSGGLMALNTRATFGTVYVTSGTGTGTGLTLKTPTYQLQNVAVFSRTADTDTWAELSGSAFKVTEGTANGGSIYFCDSRDSGGVIGTTAVSFTKIAGITTSSGSTSLTNTGAGDNVLQDEPILNDPVIKIRVAQSGNGSFSFGVGNNYDSYTLKLPTLGAEDTIVARNTYDVLNNKTLIRPFITSINTGPADGYFVSTLPQQTTTLVGTDTTDTLTNKTIESSILTGDTTLSSTSTFTPAAGATLDLSAANVILPSSTLSGFGYKAPVRAATTANIALSGIQTIDTTVVLVAGDRVLVKNQSTDSQNGIYIVNASTWTRSTDLNVWSEASAAVVVVQEGTLNQDTVWLSTANATGTIGSTSMPWGMIGVDQTGSGLTTQVLVGGGENIKPVWTTATGTGAPVRAGSPTFTGTVGGITKSMVGLSDVDNTTDLGKPVSTATQTALGLKANLASPTLTTPVIAQINSSYTTAVLKLASTASSVNYITIEQSIAGQPPHIYAEGETVVGLHLQAKGNGGYVNIQDPVDSTKRIRFGAGLSATNAVTTLEAVNPTASSIVSINLPGANTTLAGLAISQTFTGSTNTFNNISVNGTVTINGNSVITAAQPSTSFPGSITLSGGANSGANGGSINTSGFNNSSGGRSGGSINTSANNGNNGGSINTTGNNGGAGGNIDTSNNGGYINTAGNGNRAGFINTNSNNSGYTLPAGTGGGYIYTAGNGGGNGGNINTSGSNFSSTTRAGGDINTSAGSNGVGGSINTTNGGGLIETRGNNANTGGYIKTSGWNSGGSGNNGGFIDTSANSIYRGGFIATSGNITSIPATSGNGGGYIFTAGNNGGNGGNINTSGFNNGAAARAGGEINTSATGGNNGGSINTSGNTGNAGGNINTSGGGGSITTNGSTGNIELGVAASRTTLNGSGTTCSITLPSVTTTLAGLAVTQSFTQVNTFSSSTASTSTASGAVVITGGLGVGGNAYVGGVINIPATTSTAGKITQAGNNLLHTFGIENLFLGLNAGNTTGSGQYSVGVGTRAMSSLTTGRQNLCFGWQAGYYITTGWDNMIFGGYNTGHGISTGSNNTIMGANANATNGNFRGAIGAGAYCTVDDTIVIGKAAGTYSVANVSGSRPADAVIIPGALTVSGGVNGTTVNGNTITAGTGTLTLGVNTITLAAGTGVGATGGYIDLSGGGGENNSGGYIDLSGGNTEDNNYGGYINLSGWNGGEGANCNGGYIDLRASGNYAGGYINLSSSDQSGGFIDMRGGNSANLSGGSIDTSLGGGSISTRGVGSIELGVSGTRTTLVGSATIAATVTLPNATTTLAGLSVAQTFTEAVTFSSTLAAGATTVTGNLTCGNLISTPEVVAMLGSTGGTISMSYLISAVSHGMSGTSIVTLADGTAGQIKIITATSITAGSIAIGATTKTGFTTITMSASYSSVTLVYIGASSGWMISANYNCTIT